MSAVWLLNARSATHGRLLAAAALLALAQPVPAALPEAERAGRAGMEAYPVALRAPSWHLATLDGVSRGPEDYHGRVVLLNFWASWCPPCRDEFPSLERLQRKLGGRDFTVLAVSVSDSTQGVARFLGGRPPVFDILMDDDGKVAAAFRARGVPVTYLLDRQGRLVAGKTGPQQWDGPEMEALIRQAIGRH
ncbi:MAG: TlpA family protein disulfide reductase [Betaproteobacteria bacterium]|nr:TlpA family protein disulfide reductase [Betaproteobacteria bacterium]